MAWICGKHPGTEIANGKTCLRCYPAVKTLVDNKTVLEYPGTRGRGWTAAEIEKQVAEAKAHADRKALEEAEA